MDGKCRNNEAISEKCERTILRYFKIDETSRKLSHLEKTMQDIDLNLLNNIEASRTCKNF